jgi:NADH dehydrogenase
MILVIGATSLLGAAVAADLVADGRLVRASHRKPKRANHFTASGAEVVTLDMSRPEMFNRALDGADAIFTSTHSLTARRRDAIQRIDIDGYKALIDAAAARNISRFVFTSIMGARLDHPAALWRAKAEVERHLVASGLTYTILRPSAFTDFHAHRMIGARVLEGKAARILGSGETRRNLVAVSDVATLAVRALTATNLNGRILEIGGPDNLTDREVASLYARLADLPVKIQALPPPALAILASLAGPFHAGVANILRLPLHMDSWPNLTFDSSSVAALIGRSPMSVEAFARARMKSRPIA